MTRRAGHAWMGARFFGLTVGGALLLCTACESRPSAAPIASPPTAARSAAPSALPPATATTSQAAASPTGDCTPAIDGDSKRLRLFGRGSHGLAETNLTIELGSGKMSGSTYELDGKDVKPVAVDLTLRPEELSKLKKALAATCVVPQEPTGDAKAVPGGYSYLEIGGAETTLWVMFGTPHEKMPAGARFASLSRDEWKRLTSAYPETRPSKRAARPAE